MRAIKLLLGAILECPNERHADSLLKRGTREAMAVSHAEKALLEKYLADWKSKDLYLARYEHYLAWMIPIMDRRFLLLYRPKRIRINI